MIPTNRTTPAAQLMVMPHALHVVLKADIPRTLVGPYARGRQRPPRTGPPPTFKESNGDVVPERRTGCQTAACRGLKVTGVPPMSIDVVRNVFCGAR